jgi:hypothetical protein
LSLATAEVSLPICDRSIRCCLLKARILTDRYSIKAWPISICQRFDQTYEYYAATKETDSQCRVGKESASLPTFMVGFAPASPTLHLLTTAVIVSLIQGLLSPATYGDLVAIRFLCLLLKP